MFKTSAYLAASMVLLSLAGCAVTPTELRNTGNHISYVVPYSYETVYRTLADHGRACGQQNLITAQIVTQSDLYPETRSAVITSAMHGGLGVMTLSVVDIKGIDDQSSNVTITSKGPLTKESFDFERVRRDVHDCT
jgi:hypothetical protein